MTSDFSVLSALTVLPTYSWDDGPALLSGGNVVLSSCNLEQGMYIGYAPTVILKLSSTSVAEISSGEVLWHKWTFGDLYNHTTNVFLTSALSVTPYHVYLMPGTYDVTLELIKTSEIQPIIAGCETIHQRQWVWTNMDCGTANAVTFDDTTRDSTTPKTWYDEQQHRGEHCAIWSWAFLKSPETGLDYVNTPVRWNETYVSERFRKRWIADPNESPCTNIDTFVPTVSSTSVVYSEQAFLKVEEILPAAFLSGNTYGINASTEISVHLTPRHTIAGSFTFDKIIWDLDDGTEPIVISRFGSAPTDSRFTFTSAISADLFDPRNYDVTVAYRWNSTSKTSYYPSITAISSNTGSSDEAAWHVGPFVPPVSSDPLVLVDFIPLSSDALAVVNSGSLYPLVRFSN